MPGFYENKYKPPGILKNAVERRFFFLLSCLEYFGSFWPNTAQGMFQFGQISQVSYLTSKVVPMHVVVNRHWLSEYSKALER